MRGDKALRGQALHWDDLRVVSAVHRSGSFMRAARELDLNETTVARRIARIEATLGFRLYDTVDGMRWPTEGCRAILQSLAAMERAAAEVSAVRNHVGILTRRLRLSTIEAIAEYLIAPRLGELLDAEPGLTLEIEAADQNVDMSRWQADLAIRLGRPDRGAFNMRRIGEIDFYIASPARPGRRRTTERSDRPAASLPLIGYPDALANQPEMAGLATHIGAGPVRIQTSSYALIRRLIDAGAGIGVLPGFIVRSLPDTASLTLQRLPARREVWLLTQSHSRDDALARRVADWCAALFEPLPPLPP